MDRFWHWYASRLKPGDRALRAYSGHKGSGGGGYFAGTVIDFYGRNSPLDHQRLGFIRDNSEYAGTEYPEEMRPIWWEKAGLVFWGAVLVGMIIAAFYSTW